MKRRIIQIDQDICNGCGLCVNACHEGAIQMIDCKAQLIRDDCCDGLGDCLPVCPTNAISFIEREALEYNEQVVLENKKRNNNSPCECPGSNSKVIKRNCTLNNIEHKNISSMLLQWPVQIKLVPINAPYFDNANLLIVADCCAFAYGNFHNDFMKNHITLIGCPKLDEGDYSIKLTKIIKNNNIKSLTIVRMEVPCCGGIEAASKKALLNSGKFIPWKVVTISTDGKILD